MKRFGLPFLALCLISAAPLPPPDDGLIQSDALPATLGETRLFYGQHPSPNLKPYTLSTPLFTDYAEKQRWLYLPPGTRLTWKGDGLPEFPVGAVLVKNFAWPADLRKPAEAQRLIETRLLIKRASGWVALPYVWDGEGKAALKRAGTRVSVSWTHLDGTPRQISHAVPNVNQCKGCHDAGGALTPIGPKARNLALQLGAPQASRPLPHWTDNKTPLTLRARAYLDVNCGHCHNREGPADTSGLWLDWDQPADTNLGLYKRPTAAGRGSAGLEFAIQPGKPDRSYLITRMQSLDPGVAMPELGRATVHEEGVALLARWISEMPQ